MKLYIYYIGYNNLYCQIVHENNCINNTICAIVYLLILFKTNSSMLP